MSKTIRINLLVSPQEKADLDARAKRAKLTTSELVRRAVAAYDPEVDMDALQTLAQELAAVVERTEKKLDDNLAAIAELRGKLADEAALKAAARAELEAKGQVWPFPLDENEPKTSTP